MLLADLVPDNYNLIYPGQALNITSSLKYKFVEASTTRGTTALVY
jgi:hypothetical protein